MDDTALLDALAASQRLGMLGARPLPEVIEHAGAEVAGQLAEAVPVADDADGRAGALTRTVAMTVAMASAEISP